MARVLRSGASHPRAPPPPRPTPAASDLSALLRDFGADAADVDSKLSGWTLDALQIPDDLAAALGFGPGVAKAEALAADQGDPPPLVASPVAAGAVLRRPKKARRPWWRLRVQQPSARGGGAKATKARRAALSARSSGGRLRADRDDGFMLRAEAAHPRRQSGRNALCASGWHT